MKEILIATNNKSNINEFKAMFDGINVIVRALLYL